LNSKSPSGRRRRTNSGASHEPRHQRPAAFRVWSRTPTCKSVDHRAAAQGNRIVVLLSTWPLPYDQRETRAVRSAIICSGGRGYGSLRCAWPRLERTSPRDFSAPAVLLTRPWRRTNWNAPRSAPAHRRQIHPARRTARLLILHGVVRCYPTMAPRAGTAARSERGASCAPSSQGRQRCQRFFDEPQSRSRDTHRPSLCARMRLRDAIRDITSSRALPPMITDRLAYPRLRSAGALAESGLACSRSDRSPNSPRNRPDRRHRQSSGNAAAESAMLEHGRRTSIHFIISARVPPHLHRPDFVEVNRAALQRWKIIRPLCRTELTEMRPA